MNISQLSAWVQQMTRLGEADIPYTSVDGRRLTPRQILQAAQSDPILWAKIQAVMGDPMYCPACGYQTPDMTVSACPQCGGRMTPVGMTLEPDLLKERFRKRVEEGRVPVVHRMHDGEVAAMTPEEQMREVERGTLEGQAILLAEAKLMEELERRRLAGG
ncbi:MAG: hypothetical protein PHU95_02260 [Candidatus Thermoplasmatota archaeon]|nr:hypothetical protein [Candidatus Thermoplasmatota archaeon]MDD5778255.1 hypothetical protein [Candidatus Thermoplasmatota archaeon]